MNKYYYHKGMCETLHYYSLNPIIYEQTENKEEYKKIKMDCNAIASGKCDKSLTCPILQDAPEIIIDNNINLSKNKLDKSSH